MRISELKIDPDFRDCLPKLTEDEYSQLEKNVVTYGVQSPLVVWNGYIIDGHNRYSICFANHITDVPVREEHFEDKESALKWILENQLGRRNLTDFGRNEIALRYKEIIAQKAKERQREGQEAGRVARYSGLRSDDQKPEEQVNTRTEIAKIAGTNDSSVKRTEFILKNGTEEEINRARKGGKGNRQATIVKEIQVRATAENKKACSTCGEVKTFDHFRKDPNSSSGYRSQCKECENAYDRKRRASASADKELLRQAKEVEAYMMSTEERRPYTPAMLNEEVEVNSQTYVSLLHSILTDRKEMLDNEDTRQMLRKTVDRIVTAILKVKEDLL